MINYVIFIYFSLGLHGSDLGMYTAVLFARCFSLLSQFQGSDILWAVETGALRAALCISQTDLALGTYRETDALLVLLRLGYSVPPGGIYRNRNYSTSR